MREIEGSSPDRVNPKEYALQILPRNKHNVSEWGNMYIPGKLALSK